MLVGVSRSGQVVRLVALRHVVPVDVLVARRHVDRGDVLGARLAFAVIDHSALRPYAACRGPSACSRSELMLWGAGSAC
jgi:hypothetical protein